MKKVILLAYLVFTVPSINAEEETLCEKQWNILKTLLPQDPEKRGKGMPHANFRSVLNTIF